MRPKWMRPPLSLSLSLSLGLFRRLLACLLFFRRHSQRAPSLNWAVSPPPTPPPPPPSGKSHLGFWGLIDFYTFKNVDLKDVYRYEGKYVG